MLTGDLKGGQEINKFRDCTNMPISLIVNIISSSDDNYYKSRVYSKKKRTDEKATDVTYFHSCW